MSRNRQSLLRDLVELLRDLSMGVTEAHTVELPHGVESKTEPAVTDVVWTLK